MHMHVYSHGNTMYMYMYLEVSVRWRRRETLRHASQMMEHSSNFPETTTTNNYMYEVHVFVVPFTYCTCILHVLYNVQCVLYTHTYMYSCTYTHTCAVLCSADKASCQKLVVRGTEVEASKADTGTHTKIINNK